MTGGKIRGGAVGNSDIATDAVTSSKLRGGSVGNTDLADNAVGSSKVADGTLTAADIRDGDVVEGNGRILANTVTLPDGSGATTLLSAPGLGALRASCAAGVATTSWLNTGTASVAVVNQVAFHDTTPTTGIDAVHAAISAPGGSFEQPANLGENGWQTVTWQASVDDSAGDRVATVTVTSLASGANCRVSAQGLSTA